MKLARWTRSASALALAALASTAGVGVGSDAAYGAYTLVSGSSSLQAEDAYSPAVSADGRYVAFVGSIGGIQGIYRKDLQTGELALAAGTDPADPALNAPDAGAPSISGEGRYVSFTTTKALDPADDAGKGCSSVYRRDMDVPIGAPGAYKLVSALNGQTKGISYIGSFSAGESCPGGGSAAAERVAISENGEKVVFTIDGSSDLTGECTAAPSVSCPTPPGQVAVRNLETDTTTFVSQTMSSIGSNPEPVPDGAALTDYEAASQIGDSTAAISADGSTVAWMGIDIPEQAPASSADTPVERPNEYDEPLWRKIEDGPDAPTRRVTGGDDPLCPGSCSGPLETQWKGPAFEYSDPGPVRGTYIDYQDFGNGQALKAVTPQLSANGQEVAILSTQPAVGQIPIYTHRQPTVVSANAFVVNMAQGLSRSQALTRLTDWASDEFDEEAFAGPIQELAISPDGTRVAFTTRRIIFSYSPPALITPPLNQVPEGSQLYLANLSANTLQMLSYGYNEAPASSSIGEPAFIGEDELAFASGATNLVYGAYNSGGSDIFLTSLPNATPEPGQQSFTPLPVTGAFAPEWTIGASVRRGPHGSVLLNVSVPAAGSVAVTAQAAVPIAHGSARRARAGVVAQRTVASARVQAQGPGYVHLRLSAAARYHSLVDSRDGLYGKLTIMFSAPGHGTLKCLLPIEFHVAPKPAKKRRPTGRMRGNRRQRRRRK